MTKLKAYLKKMDAHLPPHGTASRYERYACRCGECKLGHNAKMRAYREKRRERTGWKAP